MWGSSLIKVRGWWDECGQRMGSNGIEAVRESGQPCALDWGRGTRQELSKWKSSQSSWAQRPLWLTWALSACSAQALCYGDRHHV